MSSGDDGRQRGVRLAWAFYDWAQQPYYTLIGSFVFRPYFVGLVAVSPQVGQAQIGYTAAIAGLIVALVGPVIGLALERGSLKVWLAATSAPFALACTGLWWARPGGDGLLLTLVCLTAAAALAEIATIVNNAMLPPIAAPGR